MIVGLYWSYMGIMEKKMETTIILGLFWSCMEDNGKEHGNYYSGVI